VDGLEELMKAKTIFRMAGFFFVSALVLGQTASAEQATAETQTVTTAIPGVVAAGT